VDLTKKSIGTRARDSRQWISALHGFRFGGDLLFWVGPQRQAQQGLWISRSTTGKTGERLSPGFRPEDLSYFQRSCLLPKT
jgi:hypothetical protein